MRLLACCALLSLPAALLSHPDGVRHELGRVRITKRPHHRARATENHKKRAAIPFLRRVAEMRRSDGAAAARADAGDRPAAAAPPPPAAASPHSSSTSARRDARAAAVAAARTGAGEGARPAEPPPPTRADANNATRGGAAASATGAAAAAAVRRGRRRQAGRRLTETSDDGGETGQQVGQVEVDSACEGAIYYGDIELGSPPQRMQVRRAVLRFPSPCGGVDGRRRPREGRTTTTGATRQRAG